MDRLGTMTEVQRNGATAYEGAIGQAVVRLEPAPGEKKWRLVLVEPRGDTEVAQFNEREEPNKQIIYTGRIHNIFLELRPEPGGWVMFADRRAGTGQIRF